MFRISNRRTVDHVLLRRVASVLAIAFLLVLPMQAKADEASEPAGEQYCGRLAEIEVALSREFDEHLMAVAQANNEVVRLYLSQTRRSWTLLAIAAAHPHWACIVGAGTDFDFVRPAPGDAVAGQFVVLSQINA